MLLWPFRWLAWLLTRAVLSLRYRVTVTGKRDVFRHPGPYLVLPNHPAFADPINLITHLWPAFRIRPLVLETNFRNPVLAPFAWILRAIKIPALVTASAEERKQAEDAMANVIAALKAGENVVLWPSGRLSRDGREHVGGARAAADILAAVPNATVVLARSRGLWGSSFSRAQTQQELKLVGQLLKGVAWMLANLLFFMPRRRYTIALEAFPTGSRPEPTREAINPWLEAWFNADLDGGEVLASGGRQPPVGLHREGEAPAAPRVHPGSAGASSSQETEETGGLRPPLARNLKVGETPTFVPYHFLFGRRTFDFPPVPVAAEVDASSVKPATVAAVGEFVSEKLKRPLTDAENTPDTTFAALGIDSLDAMEITLQVEQRFGFSGDAVPTRLGDLWALAEGAVEHGEAKPAPAAWFAPPGETGTMEILGETVGEAFVNRALRSRRDVAAADDRAGVLTYERLLVGARVMAERFRAFDEPNVGLLMPASVAADIALMGLHLAGKLPVVLNWTTGPNNLEHAVTLMKLKRVITSKAFIDRTNLVVPGAEFVFLEDVRKSVGKIEMLSRLLGGRWFPASAKRKALRHAVKDPNAPAVVLFTSGSEKAPKAVPLTHANVIANNRATAAFVKLTRADSLLGFLPLFHSFGHTVAALLPLLSGIRLLHHPDPTDASGLVRKIAGYKPTVICATPTFFGFILDRAKPGELDSLTCVVVGAERCPDAVFEKAKTMTPNGEILEGYGITECSPIVAANPPGRTRRGTIGVPLPGVEVCVTELDTRTVLPAGERGMMHVSGPNVFPGYLGDDAPDPFAEFDGKTWYVTGDLASLDADGYITFHGRLKRFIKAGGEMISLPALEEPFARKYPPTDAGPRVAVEGVELPGGGRKVVLFTTEDVSERDANALLQAEGFRGVMRLDEVRKEPSIPVLGTGKTDYKQLRAKLG